MTAKKSVRYWDPKTQRHVNKEIDVPAPLDVKTLPGGATVQDIDSMEDLKAMWGKHLTSDLHSPLDNHGRGVLRDALLEVISDTSERDAITNLTSTHHFNDDRLLKLVSRLVGEVSHNRNKREHHVTKLQRLIHEKELWLKSQDHLKGEVKVLTKDVERLVNERDLANRRTKNAHNSESSEARASLHRRVNELEALVEKTAVERDVFKRDTERTVEVALTEYETEVMGKLGSVAAEHKVAVDERNQAREQNAELEKKIARLTNEIQNTQVKKEAVMDTEQNTDVEVVSLSSGDEVHCKISGEGPFVLVTQVEEGIVKYANPVPGQKNHFHAGEVPIHRPWLVRDRTGSMQCLPASILTKEEPKRTFSFGGVKNLVTSDVTSKLFQAAIWITMLTLLYMQRG